MNKNPYDYHATPMAILVPAYGLLVAAGIYGWMKGHKVFVAVGVGAVLAFMVWRKWEQQSEIRKTVRELLGTYASGEKQVQMEKDSPVMSIPAELQGAWAGVYHPEIAWFRSCFNSTQLGVLDAFNVVFQAQVLKLNPRAKSIRLWQKDRRWKAVMKAAAEAGQRLA